MHAYPHAEITAQVATMREEMREHGESHVGCHDLTLLCRDIVSDGARTTGVKQIAQWEGWTFVGLPDGSVRFFGPRMKCDLS